MARTALSVQTMGAWGGGVDDIAWTAADATNDHEFLNDGNYTLLLMKNDSGGSLTSGVLGVATARTFNQSPDITLTCGAGETCIYGPFDSAAFNQVNSLVHMNLSTDTSLFFAVVKITPTPGA